MKKILVNAYVNLNFGDDLFLKILFDRYKDVCWTIAKAPSIYSEIFKEYPNVEIKNGIKSKMKNKFNIIEKNTILSKYSMGIHIGGSIFMQLPEWKKQLEERKKIIKSFARKGKEYFVIGANFGPFSEIEFINKYKEVFKDCTDVCFRDEYSYELFKNYKHIRKAPDIVFQLKVEKIKKIKNSIGISIIELRNRPNLKGYKELYIKKIVEIIQESVIRGKSITFFSFCEAEGDLEAIKEIMNTIEEKYRRNVKYVEYTGDISDFLKKFSEMENIIGTRFHACILSQVFNQGLYPLIYSDKTYNVLKDIELDKEYSYIKNIDNVHVNHILEVISMNKIKDRGIFKEAEKQFEVLDKYVYGK
ncbi:MAG: polysaccharide pyruvyl transferase family protein [Clostridium sp.]